MRWSSSISAFALSLYWCCLSFVSGVSFLDRGGVLNTSVVVAPTWKQTANLNQVVRQKPVIVFLFLVIDKINNEEIWDRFFAPALQGTDYRILVHCKSVDGCRSNIKSPQRYEMITAVETKYCADLVSGMNALLQAGVSSVLPGRPDDKFVFISDSTLPVKPFSVVQSRLQATGPNSHFCVFPRNEWAEIQEAGFVPSVRAAVKHHQWLILSRTHAMQVLERSHEHRDLMTQFRINTMGFEKNTGCLDEFWHFAILFGTISHATSAQLIRMAGLSGPPLSTTDYQIQGQCDTFVQWVPRASGTSNNMTGLTTLLSQDPGVDMTAASDKRPAAFHRFSLQAVQNLRDSWFLFARKVDDQAAFAGCDSLASVMDKVVFSVPPQSVEVESSWSGEGKWIDSRHYPVTITSSSGSVQLDGGGPGMMAKGTFCKDRMDVVFSNGYRSYATLSKDGQYLSWATGVSWNRAA
mmetsp:Transcript_56703/g.90168  ORF Transcript_56703/g.90168 Transcript_56703/m.90168 type:complete len:465 (-) Transcript_56703:78-1472(-)